VRNPIAAGADHSVEYPAGRRQARTAIGFDDLIDERIDDWIGNAGEILRALHRGGLRGKIAPQRVARRGRKGEPLNREVEVEIIDPFAILYRVNNAQSDVAFWLSPELRNHISRTYGAAPATLTAKA
jgi:hypothetical protein